MSEKKVVAGLSLKADQFKQELEEIRALEKAATDAGESFATSFSDGFTRIEERSQKMSATLAAGGEVSKRTFHDTIATLAKLEAAATAGGKSLEEAPEPIRKAFEVAHQQLTAVAGQMQVNAANTEALRDRLMQAGAQAAGLATSVKSVSDAMGELSESEQKAAKAAEDVEKKFGDIPDRIEEIKKAGDRTFDEQIDDLKKVAGELKDAEKAYAKMGAEGAKALDGIRPKADQVKTAITELATKASSDAGRISDAVVITERHFEDLAKQIRQNPKEAVEALPKVAGAVIQLRNAIEAARKTGGPIDPRAVADLQRFEAQLASTKTEVGQLKREIDQHAVGVVDAGNAWQGFDSVINRAAGSMGKFGVAAVGGFMALKEAIAIGNQIAQAIGTDYEAAEKATAGFKESLASITAVLTTDGWAAAMDQASASIKFMENSLFSGGAALNGFNEVVASGVSRAEALKIAQGDLITIGQLHRVAVEGGTEALELWRNVIANVPTEQLAKKLGELREQFEALRAKNRENIEAEQDRQKLNKDALTQFDAIIGKLKAERTEREAGLTDLQLEIDKRGNLKKALEEAARAESFAKDVKGGLSDSMAEELELLAQALPAYKDNRVEIEALAAALEADTEAYRQGLTPERQKELEQLAEQLKRYGELDPVQRGAVQRKIDLILKEREAATATKEHSGELQKINGVITNVGKASDDAAGKLKGGTIALTSATEQAKKAAPELERTGKAVEAIATSAIKLGQVKGTFTDFAGAMKDSGPTIETYKQKLDDLSVSLEALAMKAERAGIALKNLGKDGDDEARVAAGPDLGSAAPDAQGTYRGTTGSW